MCPAHTCGPRTERFTPRRPLASNTVHRKARRIRLYEKHSVGAVDLHFTDTSVVVDAAGRTLTWSGTSLFLCKASNSEVPVLGGVHSCSRSRYRTVVVVRCQFALLLFFFLMLDVGAVSGLSDHFGRMVSVLGEITQFLPFYQDCAVEIYCESVRLSSCFALLCSASQQ
jgi:hypothetical protein